MPKPRLTDFGTLVALPLAVAAYAIAFVDFSISPFEDAAMIMRYALHIAAGHGIVWNIGEPPVDGATDFLFMMILAGCVKLGAQVELATRGLCLAAHVLTVWTVYLCLRQTWQAPWLPASLAALYLAIGPGLYYIAAYFGTPFFALFAALAWWQALSLLRFGETTSRSVLFAVLSLIAGLVRPEGVILTSLMLLAIVWHVGLARTRRVVLSFVGVFVILGGAYFLWRWQYFGHPLPNPFYRKGGLLIGSAVRSFAYTVMLCLPFVPAWFAGLYGAQTRRLAIATSVPVVGLTLAFGLISNEMNFGSRFQYPLLPLVLMAWWPLLAGARTLLAIDRSESLAVVERRVLRGFALTLCIAALAWIAVTGRTTYYSDGRYPMARMLAEYRDRGYTIATTEAGLLPLYSGWHAIDAWGLNDPWIAHNGGITTEYLATTAPELIVFHEFHSPAVGIRRRCRPEWFAMTQVMQQYAEANQYELAACYGDSPYDTHYYYVRRDFVDSAEMIRRIREMDYSWNGTGRRAVNYALLTEH